MKSTTVSQTLVVYTFRSIIYYSLYYRPSKFIKGYIEDGRVSFVVSSRANITIVQDGNVLETFELYLMKMPTVKVLFTSRTAF